MFILTYYSITAILGSYINWCHTYQYRQALQYARPYPPLAWCTVIGHSSRLLAFILHVHTAGVLVMLAHGLIEMCNKIVMSGCGSEQVMLTGLEKG